MCNLITVFGVIGVCVLAASVNFGSPVQKPVNLHQVNILFRHGDRTPSHFYPNDPHLDYAWPGGPGALTTKGMLQMYTLGERLRRMYGSLIGKNYHTKDLLARSSFIERCIMSAQALLAGLYRSEPEDQFVPGLPWRPIPVHIVSKEMDKMITAVTPCPRHERDLQQAYLNHSASFGDDSLSSIFKELSTHTGKQIASITDILELYNTIKMEALHNLTLPNWAEDFYHNHTIVELVTEAYAIFTKTLVQRRLRGGLLLKSVLQNIWRRCDGIDQRKMHLYAIHDFTMVNILRAMGFTQEAIMPEYGAALIFELHTMDDGQDYEMKILYLNNTETDLPHIINVPGCGQPCLLKNLSRIFEPVLPRDWDRECLDLEYRMQYNI